MLPSNIKLVIFDFDGTINNDKLRHFATAKRVYARFRLIRFGITPIAMIKTRGVPPKARKGAKARQVTFQFLKYWNPRAFPPWIRAWFYLNYEWEYSRVGKKYLFLFPGVVDLMKELRAAGYFLGIATNRESGTVKQQLKLAGILSLFTGVFGYNNVRRGKPHPEMIFRNANSVQKKSHLRLTSREILVVGDNLKEDIRAGTRAGVYTAWVEGIQTSLNEIPSIKPNLVITNVLALKQSLLNSSQASDINALCATK